MIGIREDQGGPVAGSRAALLVPRIFEEPGWLSQVLGLSHRPQQERMAREVASAMLEDETLLFEAGTGVGKSLAYLLPGLIIATDRARPLLVSTHTISLQEQLETKDLPLCRKLFSLVPDLEAYGEFKSAVLVGKSNYLCTTRLAHALQSRHELFPNPEQEELQRIADWARESAEGLRQELSPAPREEVWEWVSADSSSCSSRHCDPRTCFYQKARARLRHAQIIIVNHSLLFALLNAGGAMEKGASRGVLFPNDFLVLDEAHTVPDIATEHFGLRISSYGVDRLLKHLYSPARKRGLLQKYGGAAEQLLVKDCLESAEGFFGSLMETLLARQPVVRVRTEDCADWDDTPFKLLIKSLDTLAGRFDDGIQRETLLEQRTRLAACHNGIRRFLKIDEEDHVYWMERGGRRGQIVTLRTAPIDPAPDIREALFSRKTSVTLTSATLAVAGSVEPFRARIGAAEQKAVIVDSPFDYQRNMRVYVAADMPAPSPGQARLDLAWLVDYIGFCTLRVRGGSLLLFTSYNDLYQVADALQDTFDAQGRPVFVQGRDFSRGEIVRRFLSARNGILFGTESFWTGVDVPGEPLSQVILTRLPFEPPNHPVTQARSDWIREEGGNPFQQLTLPEALIKFRQGIGRLIRTQTDEGLITILDSRILNKPYGRQFLACLPKPDFTRITKGNRETEFRPFSAPDAPSRRRPAAS